MQCHPNCPWCARDFWKWLKARMAAMSRKLPGQSVSFAEAAATSLIPPKED